MTPWIIKPVRLPSPLDFPVKDTGGLPFPSSGDLFNLGIEPTSPALLSDSLLSGPPEKAQSSTFHKGKTIFKFSLGPPRAVFSAERTVSVQ